MIPTARFAELVKTYKLQLDEDFGELQMAADLMAQRPNYMSMDDVGMFHAQASGPIDEVVRALKHHLERLERIQLQQGAPKS